MSEQAAAPKLPRVAISYCTQCRWMLRAAYFGQELLSTFGTSIGEIALIPVTGGVFQVHLTYLPDATEDGAVSTPRQVLLWDRKAENGFPETKVLKQRLRDYIEPGKDLGHSDKPSSKSKSSAIAAEEPAPARQSVNGDTAKPDIACEDCK